ncbi:MAG: outer membrane beta-barrel protein [Aquificae bacterium]|nr:outer membrane beta-barrel protein [Aquificota bacterium]
MKKVLGLAAAGLLTVGLANAGTLTVANSDIVLYGGVSASYDWQDTDHAPAAPDKYNDKFRVSSFAIGLTKKADVNSPIGFNAAFASFAVPTVVASPDFVNNNDLIVYGKTSDFKPWLAYVTIAPIEGLSVDAGLLWSKYGEAPLTILNRHYNRGALFVLFKPVLYAGARASYDLGIAEFYAGYNQGGGLFQQGISDAWEAGVSFNLKDFIGYGGKVALHTYDESQGRNFYTLCTHVDFGILESGIQVSYMTKDDAIDTDPNKDDNMWGIAFNINFDLLDAQIANVTFPIRIEYVDLDLQEDDKVWTFTITPTWKPTGNTFARVEFAYTSADANLFVDVDDNTADDVRTSVAFEAGFLF